MTPLLDVRDLQFRYPDGRVALAGASLTMTKAERVALLGPNGAGKTTLALHLNGIHRAARGTVSVNGVEIDDSSVADIRRRVGLVFQDPNDQLFMPTVREDVAFGPANQGLRGRDLEDAVIAGLGAVGALDLANRVPHHLSGGERRRAALATVLSMRPELLVLDEPTSGLDPAGRRELIEVLCSLGMALLVITHDLPLALELCPRSVVMNNGVVVADGKTRDLLADPEVMAANRLELPMGFDPSFSP